MIENIEKQELEEIENPENILKEKKPNKFWKFIKRHKMSSLLFILLIIVLSWALIKIQIVKNNSEKEVKKITEVTNQKIDSIKLASLKQTSTVFAWAIRSELIRQNLDQISQFFSSFVKQDGVIKLTLIDQNNQVILSTDKKDEQSKFTDSDISTSEIIIKHKDNFIRVITPIMGLNEKLGVLVIDYSK